MALHYTQYVVLPVIPPKAIVQAARSAAREELTFLQDGPFCAVSKEHGESREKAVDVVQRVVLLFLDAMLEAELMDEDEMVEPRGEDGTGMIFLGSGRTPPPDACVSSPRGALDADGLGYTALALCRRLSPGIVYHPSHLHIMGSMSWDRKTAWVGLLVRRLVGPHMQVKSVDGHISLCYLTKTAVQYLDMVVERLRTALRQSVLRGVERFDFRGLLNEQFATEDYCWLDLIVHTPIHGTMHQFVARATEPPVQRTHVLTKKASCIIMSVCMYAWSGR